MIPKISVLVFLFCHFFKVAKLILQRAILNQHGLDVVFVSKTYN